MHNTQHTHTHTHIHATEHYMKKQIALQQVNEYNVRQE
jgi:hypothetical protein